MTTFHYKVVTSSCRNVFSAAAIAGAEEGSPEFRHAPSLQYEPGWIEPSHTYAVRAEIHDLEGALRFTTTIGHPVLTQGAPNEVEIVLEAAN